MTIKKPINIATQQLPEDPLPETARILLYEFAGLTGQLQVMIRNIIPACNEGINTILLSDSSRKTDQEFLNENGFVKSRTLSVKEHWPEIMDCAASPHLQIIILGKKIITKDILKDDILLQPPFSLPGKLLALLYKRFHAVKAAPDKGLIIVSGNNDPRHHELLEALVFELAHLNNLDPLFIDWIENANKFYGIHSDRRSNKKIKTR